MKNLILPMNGTILSTLLLAGCNLKDPIALPRETTEYSIINGDTVKTETAKEYKKIQTLDPNNKKYITVGDTIITFKNPTLPALPNTSPNLISIKNQNDPALKGQPLTLMVIGGSMSAGVRDGGYFNEGILSSYPNLIARQMKLSKFEQPMFSSQQYNGIGRRVKSGYNPTGGPIQKFNIIKNNLAAEFNDAEDVNDKKIKLPVYAGVPDNIAAPFFSRFGLYIDGATSSFTQRFINKKNEIGYELCTISYLKSKKFDFFIVETGIDDLLDFVHTGGGAIWSTNVPSGAKDYTFQEDFTPEEYQRIQPELKLIREVLVPAGAKGVFLNIPDILELPYFLDKNYILNYDNVVKQELLKQSYLGLIYSYLPSSKIDSLLSPLVNITLKPVFDSNRRLNSQTDFVAKENSNGGANNIILGTQRLNDQLINFNKKYGYGIVDIKTLYKKVLSKEGYIADDGTVINSKNFFSLDGINPTSLGQAVIANEVIKTINQTYKTELRTIGLKE